MEAAVAAAAAAAAQRADGARTVYVGVAVQNSGKSFLIATNGNSNLVSLLLPVRLPTGAPLTESR